MAEFGANDGGTSMPLMKEIIGKIWVLNASEENTSETKISTALSDCSLTKCIPFYKLKTWQNFANTDKPYVFIRMISYCSLSTPYGDIDQGAVSIRKTVLPGMAIPMLKIRRPNGRLIFNMEIAIRRWDGLYIETGPWVITGSGTKPLSEPMSTSH